MILCGIYNEIYKFRVQKYGKERDTKGKTRAIMSGKQEYIVLMALIVGDIIKKHILGSLNTTELCLACGRGWPVGAGCRHVAGQREFSGLSEQHYRCWNIYFSKKKDVR